MAKLLARTDPELNQDDDAFSFWDFKDLLRRKIVSTRTDLHRKQRFYGFPKPVILTGGKGAAALYKIAAVKAWLIERERLAAHNTAPELKADSRPRGRPRKDSA